MELARQLIDDHESTFQPAERRSGGVHYTPRVLADFLAATAVATVLERLGHPPRSVCDTSCGAGSFLVAAAEQLARLGVDPIEVVRNRITGFDLDPPSVAVARRALVSWAESRSGRRLESIEPNVHVADGLDVDRVSTAQKFDLVIGNPPFLSQLRSATALDRERFERLSDALGGLDPYVDTSTLFLLLAARATTPGGVTCLIQPQSFLAVRGSQSVRDRLLDSCDLLELWSSEHQFFDASVRVCAVTVSPRPIDKDSSLDTEPDSRRRTTADKVDVVWGGTRKSMEHMTRTRVDAPASGASWGPLLSAAMGIPSVEPRSDMHLGQLVTATAGFRDEYYALRDACIEATDDDPLRLTTVGMIRPCGSSWGDKPRRIGGKTWNRPTVDLGVLETANPRVAAWVQSRLVPKVLVATQSRIVEVVPDLDGSQVPMTPVISVEPRPNWRSMIDPDGDFEVDLWWLVAALSAPPVSALALSQNLGTGLSAQSLRWSAKTVQQVLLPIDLEAWSSGAAAARSLALSEERERIDTLGELGHSMCRAHGLVEDGELFDWWFERARRALVS